MRRRPCALGITTVKETDAQAFGEKLKELRMAANLTRAALAKKSGMNLHGIAKIEQGVSFPSFRSVLMLCDALEISCEVFADVVRPKRRRRRRKRVDDDK